MSLAVTFWEGWVAAHPVTLLVSGALAVLWVLFVAAYYRLTGDEGAPQSPRRGTRSRARGTRARRRVSQRARRRARATAGGTSWGRQAIALRIQRFRRCPCGKPITHTEFCYGFGPTGGLHLRSRRAVLAARARRAARGALRASVYPGRPGQKACPRCGAPHKEPHCADGREWGPFPGPETPGNGCGQPRTPPNGCEFPPGPPHGLPVSGPGGATGPARLATGAGQPRQQETPPGGYGRALEPWRGPRLHYAAGLCWCGQYHDQREPTRLAAGAGQDAARLDYQPAAPFADCLSDETIARGFPAVK